MKSVIFACLVSGLFIGTAIAQDLGNSRELPVKNSHIVIYEPPAGPKQGGETIYDAYPIVDLPFSDTGTTAGFINDYDEGCPYSSSISPDVVYSFIPNQTMMITVDLCGSGYDTKTYIYDEDFNTIACNDDFYFDDICGVYVSKIENVELTGGELYYIFVDGYGGNFGSYELMVTEFDIDYLVCDSDAVQEGEPALGYGYEDSYNGGCNSPEFGNPFQTIDWTNDVDGNPPYDGEAWLCAKTGWFLNSDDSQSRDTDWYRVFALEDGMMDFTVESVFSCYMFKLAPLDCETVAVELQAICGYMDPQTLTFPVAAGEEIWLWVGPTIFTGSVTEFTYTMTVSNNTFNVVPNEEMSWGKVKSLYR